MSSESKTSYLNPLPILRSAFQMADLMVFAGIAALIYAVLQVGHEWIEPLQPMAEIKLDPWHLPLYTLFSLTRGLIAYLISLVFTLIYAYIAARIKGTDRVLIPMLDILQSIPVLGFLPGLVLAMVKLFPHQNIGLELAAILMIFTGQAWNMTFSFYNSLKSVPEDLKEASRLYRLNWWQRFLHLDLSFAATGLIWNSMMSMAGGWFFLTVSEAFVLGNRDFRLPGLGSYMSVAIEQGNIPAQIYGVISMIIMIVMIDQFIWRPLVAWSQKFNMDDTDGGIIWHSWFLEILRDSWILRFFNRQASTFFSGSKQFRSIESIREKPSAWKKSLLTMLRRILFTGIAIALIYGVAEYIQYLEELHLNDWAEVMTCTLLTFSRVIAAIFLASLWTVPAGVFIGRNPKLSQFLQPIIQIVASFPAPMLFPLVVGLITACGGTLNWGSILLLLLGTQWYILFNVIAGASSIPKELWEVTSLNRFSRFTIWKKLILPGIFPSLLTGWITAMGGAWNASIVAEYMRYQEHIITAKGLGALISQSTDRGDFHILAASVGVMAVAVVGFNRLVWRPLTHLAQNRYSMNK